ncbi:MAG: molecular chaperone [Sulfurifustis sp.]
MAAQVARMLLALHGEVLGGSVTEILDDAVSKEDAVRAEVYALLGTLLARPPDELLLAALRGVEVPGPEARGMAAAWSALKQVATRAETTAVADEYQELFIGIGRGELVPYGSWYVTGFLLEKPLAELRRDLRRFGIERQEGVSEPEDHAAALCETMSLMAGSSAIDLSVQREFFEKHVDTWMARFFGDLMTARSASFYRAVGLFGEKFLEVERTYLSMLV